MNPRIDLPCPPLGEKCETAMRCRLKDPLASCPYRKKRGVCCVTVARDGVTR